MRYDSLLIATGADPRPFAGNVARETRGRISTLRTAGDAQRLRRRLHDFTDGTGRAKPKVTILGAGLIGSETAGVLAVTRVDSGQHGTLVARLTGGEEIASDLLLVSIGVTPSTCWLRGSGLDITDGVTVDDQLRARGASRIYAAGDLARIGGGRRTEHWANAVSQGKHAALTLLYDMVGDPHGFAEEQIIDGHPDQGRFTVALTDAHESLVGVVSVGGGRLANVLKEAVRRREPLRAALAAVGG